MDGMDDLIDFSGFNSSEELENFVESKMKSAMNAWKKMHDSDFFIEFGELVNNEETLMDAYCYFIVAQNMNKGSVIDMPYMPGLVPEQVKEELQGTSLEVTSLLISSVTLRSMMLSAMMYGIWWKQNLDKLDKLWTNGDVNESSS
tara:strand:+ start:48 stop:482 length:435 start_codon:yes stop_codon:yes gene_type:complete